MSYGIGSVRECRNTLGMGMGRGRGGGAGTGASLDAGGMSLRPRSISISRLGEAGA